MGHRTREQAARLEEKLAKAGYKKYNSCLTSSEDYAYFKAIGKDDDSGECDYQIAFRFWDWEKYPRGEGMGVDVAILVSNNGRTDLLISYPSLDIGYIEGVAKEFYEFCKKHNLD